MKTYVVYFLLVTVSLFAIGCNSCKKGSQEELPLQLEDTLNIDLSEIELDILLLPPSDLMIFIFEMELKPGITNPISNVEKYIDTRSKCINLGIYMADLVYISKLNDKLKLHQYIKAVRQLSEELRIYGVFSEEVINRLEKSIHNPDTIQALSRVLQDNFVSTLDLSNRQNYLSIISMGIFIESLYLSFHNLDELSDFNEISIEVQNQRMIFNQYYRYAEHFLSDDNVTKTIVEVEPLRMFFNELTAEIEDKVVITDSKNHFTILGGEKIKLTQQDFKILKKTVSVIREQLINN